MGKENSKVRIARRLAALVFAFGIGGGSNAHSLVPTGISPADLKLLEDSFKPTTISLAQSWESRMKPLVGPEEAREVSKRLATILVEGIFEQVVVDRFVGIDPAKDEKLQDLQEKFVKAVESEFPKEVNSMRFRDAVKKFMAAFGKPHTDHAQRIQCLSDCGKEAAEVSFGALVSCCAVPPFCSGTLGACLVVAAAAGAVDLDVCSRKC